jgi:hypothetical protein
MFSRPPAEVIQITNWWLEKPLEVRRIAAHRIVERGTGKNKVAQFLMQPVPRLNAVDISVHLNLLKGYVGASVVFLRGEAVTDVPEEPYIVSIKLVDGMVKLRCLEVGTYRLVIPMDAEYVNFDDLTASNA